MALARSVIKGSALFKRAGGDHFPMLSRFQGWAGCDDRDRGGRRVSALEPYRPRIRRRSIPDSVGLPLDAPVRPSAQPRSASWPQPVERKAMHRLMLVFAFTLGTIGFAFAQAPAVDDHSAHHPAQETAPATQSSPAQSDVQSGQAAQSKPQSGQASGGAMDGRSARGMMPGMMQMMQGMQGMMRMMHQQTQAEHQQPARPQTRRDCPMMSGGSGAAADPTSMQAMMQMMQAMMQMMQAQMQPGQARRGAP